MPFVAPATRRARRACAHRFARLLVCSFFFFCSIALVAAGVFKSSLVKLHLDREFFGLLHENHLIPRARVREVAQFQGAVFDPRGYIVAYVGSYGPDFAAPGIRVTAEFSGGELRPARVVGVDERIALVVCESGERTRRPLAFGSSGRHGKPRFVCPGREGKWEVHSPSLFNVEQDDRFPEMVVQVSGLTPQAGWPAWEGSLVIDEEGRLFGIVTRADRHLLSRKIDVYRVLTAQTVRSSASRILQEGKSIRAGWLGILLSAQNRQARSGERSGSRAKVRDVVPGSPAQKAGLRPGDVILQVDGKPIGDAEDVVRIIRWRGAGKKLTLSIDRQGQVETVSALLTQRQDRRPLASWALEVPRFWEEMPLAPEKVRLYRTVLPPPLGLGFELESLTSQLAEYFHTPTGGGLLVKSVLEGSMAQSSGFLAGDVLTRINDREIASPSELRQQLRSAQAGVIVIQFIRNRRVQTQKLVLH